jgi:lysophospholipase L1-like esterase
MRMKPLSLILLLSSCFTMSFLGNIFLFSSALHYYRLLGKAKLDPLGLNSLNPIVNKTHRDNSLSTVAFLGDSRALSWPIPSTSLPITFINLGVSGQTTSQTLLRFQYLKTNMVVPDLVIIQAGINDLKTIPLFPAQQQQIISNCQKNLTDLVSLVVNSGSQVIISTIFPVGTISPVRSLFWSQDVDDAIDKCNSSIRSLSSSRVHVLESSDILAGRNRRVLQQYQKNFLHINSSGYSQLNISLGSLLESISPIPSPSR